MARHKTLQPKAPEFMVRLGLLPPYTEEDVKQAYWSKIKTLHPDHGGTLAQFNAVQQAFEQAKEYVRFRGDRRSWIAKHVDHYLQQERVGKLIEKHGATVAREATDWLRGTVGDFAELTSSVVAIRLTDPSQTGPLIDLITREHEALDRLARLELAGGQLTDALVLQLCVLRSLQRLDVSHTPITSRAMSLVDMLPSLVWLNLDGTRVGWWTRRRVKATLRRHAAHPKFAVGRTAGFRKLQADE